MSSNSNQLPDSQSVAEDCLSNAEKDSPSQSPLKKSPIQYKRYPLAAAIVAGLLLFVAFCFGCGHSLKTIVFKQYETLEYLLKKAENGNAEAMYKYSLLCKARDNRVKWLKKSAEKGYVRAQFYLGVAYDDGDFAGIDVNSDFCKKWLTKAFKKGFSMAKVYCLYKGIGVEPDKEKAWNELERGAKKGFVENQMALALFHLELDLQNPNDFLLLSTVLDRLHGLDAYKFRDKEKKEDQGRAWLEKAASNGYEPAQVLLAIIYNSEKKNDESAKWLKRAADQGNEIAKEKLSF